MVKNRSVSHLFSSGSRNQAEQLINKWGRITLIRGLDGRILATHTLRTITNSPKSRHVSTWSGQLDAAVSGQTEMSLRRKKTRLQKWEGGESIEETVAKAPSSVAPQSGPKGGPGASGPIPGGWAATLSRRGGDG